MVQLKIPNFYVIFLLIFLVMSSFEISSFDGISKKSYSNNFPIYTPFNTSFLIFMKNLKLDNDFTTETARNNSNLFELECATYQHGFSYYFQLVYELLCNDRVTNFCRDTTESLCLLTKRLVAQSADYLMKRGPKNISVYNEVIQEDVSFCTPIVCPFLTDGEIKGNFTQPLSLYDCMPRWCRVGFFIIIALDILLTISIAIPNVFVLAIAVKHSFHQTPGG